MASIILLCHSLPIESPFSDWLLCENSDHKGKGLGTFISVSHGSVHRHSADRAHPIPPVPSQPMKHGKYVFVGRLVERVMGELYGQVKKVVVVHAGIIGVRCGDGHSYFPRGS